MKRDLFVEVRLLERLTDSHGTESWRQVRLSMTKLDLQHTDSIANRVQGELQSIFGLGTVDDDSSEEAEEETESETREPDVAGREVPA